MTQEEGWVAPAFARLLGAQGAEEAASSSVDGVGMQEGCGTPTGAGRVGGEELVARVMRTVRDIPPGRTMTYGDIAALVGCGPRRVGRILSTTGERVPWWRVTNASGLLPEDLRAAAHQHYENEGTPTRGQRVDLSRSRWRPV